MKDGKFELKDINIAPLSKIYDLSEFNCGDNDLNEFLKIDSFKYHKSRLASTILVIHGDKIIGFFSLSADAIKLIDDEKEKCDVSEKPLQEYPAVKLVRLAVDKRYQGKNLGKIILRIAIGLILEKLDNSVGCRFITVDAYTNKVPFYKNYGFIINEHSKYTKKERYISMRFDLLNPSE